MYLKKTEDALSGDVEQLRMDVKGIRDDIGRKRNNTRLKSILVQDLVNEEITYNLIKSYTKVGNS